MLLSHQHRIRLTNNFAAAAKAACAGKPAMISKSSRRAWAKQDQVWRDLSVAADRVIVMCPVEDELLRSFYDFAWTITWWSAHLLSVELSNVYKGRGLLASSVKMIRPVGLAHFLLPIGSDLLLSKTATHFLWHAGPNDMGGGRDARKAATAHQHGCARWCHMGWPMIVR